MDTKVVQLQQPRVVPGPQAARAAERRDAALDLDAGAREGGEVTGTADEAGGFVNGSFARFDGSHIPCYD